MTVSGAGAPAEPPEGPSPAGPPLIEMRRTEGQPVAELLIGTGERRNALPTEGWSALEEAVQGLSADDSLRAVVVRGRGGTFCAGSDMREWENAEVAAVERSFALMEAAFRAVEECPVPVVAEIHGVAAGAGCQLALACDLRFMASTARLGMPVARLGILPSPSFAGRMTALAGPSVTRQLLYTGQLLDAAEAVAAGLADRQLSAPALTSYTVRTLARIAEQPTAAVRAAKRAVAEALAPIREATRVNVRPAVSLGDFREGVTAFLG